MLPAGCSFVYTWAATTKELQKRETDFKASRQVTEHGASSSNKQLLGQQAEQLHACVVRAQQLWSLCGQG